MFQKTQATFPETIGNLQSENHFDFPWGEKARKKEYLLFRNVAQPQTEGNVIISYALCKHTHTPLPYQCGLSFLLLWCSGAACLQTTSRLFSSPGARMMIPFRWFRVGEGGWEHDGRMLRRCRRLCGALCYMLTRPTTRKEGPGLGERNRAR